MNNDAIVIFPHQLFECHPALDKKRKIFLLEHPRFFTDFTFHKQKLVLHRATMRMYYDFLVKKKYNVTYLAYKEAKNFIKHLQKDGITHIHMTDVIDHDLEATIKEQVHQVNIVLNIYETPMFLTEADWIEFEYEGKERFLMQSFYITQRKNLDILIKNGKPVGGKWSFDAQNRKPLPSNVEIPHISKAHTNKYVTEAIEYINTNFPKNYGSTEHFIYPTTFDQAKKWLDDFLEHRFKLFGPYQDAIVQDEHFLFHSVLSPLLNIGLLTPDYVIATTLLYAGKHHVPINSTEGFIRQIIGWREFVRAVYLLRGKDQKKSNYFEHTRKLPKSFWKAKTGIEPIDVTIEKVLQTAYAHHIERLMVLGNFMLLCEIDPNQVYTWFTELFIDAYDWVMVPNVYGMSQYADHGIMTTKPYCSSSNYIRKMSDYKKGNWAAIWDGLYWNFLHKHQRVFTKNPRMRLTMNALYKMKKTKLKEHEKVARAFLKKL